MGIQDIWLAHLKQIVEREAEAAGGKLNAGYKAVSAATGIGYDFIYQLYNGKPATKRPGEDAAAAIARAYADGRPLTWINHPPGEDDGEERALSVDDFVSVRRADVRFSNGQGSVVYAEDDKPPLVFRADFLRRMGIAKGNAVVVESEGVSNEPKIMDGSVVLLNRGDREQLDGGFFGFRVDGQLLIKKLVKLPGVGILATAGNPDFKPSNKVYTDVDGDFEVIGRAVWTGVLL